MDCAHSMEHGCVCVSVCMRVDVYNVYIIYANIYIHAQDCAQSMEHGSEHPGCRCVCVCLRVSITTYM